MTHAEFIKSVIRVRELIIKQKKSYRDSAICQQKIKKIKIQVEAYGKKWDANGWRKFIQRNYDDIVFLIPGNGARKHKIEILNSLI